MKKFLFGGLIVLLLAVYFIYFSENVGNTMYTMDNINMSSPALNYSNSFFDISYPSNWIAQKNTSYDVHIRFLGPTDPEGRSMVVYVSSKDNYTSINSELIDDHITIWNAVFSNNYILKKQEEIDGKHWLYAQVEDDVDPMFVEEALVKCNDTIYLVSSLVPKTLSENLPISRAMVNSFKCK